MGLVLVILVSGMIVSSRWGNRAVEAVEASEVAEADEVNEAAEVSKGSKITNEDFRVIQVNWIQLILMFFWCFEKESFYGRIIKYQVEF
mgnify:CR=1 FL=1